MLLKDKEESSFLSLMGDFYIQTIREDDLSAIMNIERELFKFPWSDEDFKGELKSKTSRSFLLKDFKTEKALAYLCFRTILDEFEILKLAVKANWQNKGLAACLMKILEEKGRELKISKIFLEVSEQNTKAVNFYKKHGFKGIGMRKSYYPDGSKAINMIKTI